MGLTPMMQQYFQVKDNYPDCILFFRLGDFYEMFFQDAETASRELELVLTGRDCGLEQRAPMCGIPFHAANAYISRLVNKGYKIAICEQLEDPSVAKGIVKRDVIKIITPGTYIDQTSVEENKNNYIMSIFIESSSKQISLAFADISTGEVNCTVVGSDYAMVLDEVSKFNPKEILIQQEFHEDELMQSIKQRFSVTVTKKDSKYFTESAQKNIAKQFTNHDIISSESIIACSVNGLLSYIYETQKINLSNISVLNYYNVLDYLAIDSNTRKNLELTESFKERGKKGSLLWVLDKTCTSMGGRLLRKWIDQPLVNRSSIERRINSIEELIENFSLLSNLRDALKNVYDIERIAGKISSKSVNAKELISLRNSVSNIPEVKSILKDTSSELLGSLFKELDCLEDIYSLINGSIHENPSLSVKEGGIIKEGYNSQVDELRNSKAHGKEWIALLESSEREATGIRSLKVSFNKVFGYYIEITNANLGLIPKDRYIRKQTLSNAERFITPELKEMEEKILGAEEKLTALEYDLFIEVRDSIEKEILRIQNTALILSELDCLCSLALTSLENNYCKPEICEGNVLNLCEGRHPVIEKLLPIGSFISNNTSMDTDDNQLLLITGPNMAGKSTYMRQVALIVIMAQMGCYVPAKTAQIGICDKIFTRIGASDDLASGKSTFMVEMWEVSNILKNATERSLVLLDEVGRGTSTYDGLSIAEAVIEYICSNSALRCKTLFATHYHELTRLEGVVKGVINYCVAVKEVGSDIVFLRKIIRGGADQSYGIEVAKLAGLPKEVVSRAKEILEKLENSANNKDEATGDKAAGLVSKKATDYIPGNFTLSEKNNDPCNSEPDIESSSSGSKTKNNLCSDTVMFEAAITKNDIKQLDFADIQKDNLLKEISEIDILNMTPLESFNKMYELIKRAKAF